MNTKMIKVLAMALIPAVMLAVTSCSKEHKKSTAKNQPVEIGRMEAVAITTTATVAAVDPVNRTVTLQASDGTVGTYKLGKEVRNFKQIKVGDMVKVTVLESMAIFMGPSDVKPSIDAVQTVALAPKGAKPGMLMTNTAEAVARVDAIDTANRTVTLIGVAEVPRTLTVGPNVNLANVTVGENVIVRYTEAVAIAVEKP
jgi:hypothetical protein